MTDSLPQTIKPMLASRGQPFDSEEHLFEIKWDGIRAILYVEAGQHRLLTRRGSEVTDRYPELDGLARLPDGTVLDGELVVLDAEGKPDFSSVLQREQARAPLRVRQAAKALPVQFVVFDQLYSGFQPMLAEPFSTRRELLLETVAGAAHPNLIPSDGIIGPGRDYFEKVTGCGLEGLVAKKLNSKYSPGRRSDAWIKMRRRNSLLCAIIGYVPKGTDFESLILASNQDGELRYVGRVGNGFDGNLRKELIAKLRSKHCDEPLIKNSQSGQWLHPGLYCSVAFLERTKTGELREPVFERLVES